MSIYSPIVLQLLSLGATQNPGVKDTLSAASCVNLLSLLFQFGDRSSHPIEGQKRVAFHVYLTESYISLVKVCASYNSLLKANA